MSKYTNIKGTKIYTHFKILNQHDLGYSQFMHYQEEIMSKMMKRLLKNDQGIKINYIYYYKRCKMSIEHIKLTGAKKVNS